jgi:hypothetical protein
MRKTICKQCGKEFEQKRWGKNQTLFCSPECSSTWQKMNLTKSFISGRKICSCCKQEKNLNDFNSKGKKGGKHTYCKKCLYIFQMRRWNKKKIFAIDYKGGKCVECGSVEHPVNFDFHHRNQEEKEFDWSILRCRSQETIKRELDKCDLLCVRCHRLKMVDKKLWPES